VDSKSGFVIYGAGISSGLGGGYMRYILLFVPEHEASKEQVSIREVRWQNLQTRGLTYSYRLKPQAWTIPREAPDVLLRAVSRVKPHTSYCLVQPEDGESIEVLLLNDSKKKTIYQYPEKITLTAAVETFECVINRVNEVHSLSEERLHSLPRIDVGITPYQPYSRSSEESSGVVLPDDFYERVD
jgi:hypothetical protein